MKKLLSILSVVVILCNLIMLLPVSSNAISTSGWCGDNVSFTFNKSTGALTISGSGEMYDYDGSDSPFYDYWSYEDKIKSVVIKYGVSSIGNYSFDSCTELKNVSIPNSVKNIGVFAFYGCESLKSISIPNSVTIIGDDAFNGCSGLMNVSIPDSVTQIGSFAFYECTSLNKLSLPNNHTVIGEKAFGSCKSLSKVIIPELTEELGAYVFYECDNLTEVSIPVSVFIDGYYFEYDGYSIAFQKCNKIKKVILTKGTGNESDWQSGYAQWYDSRETLEEVVIDSGVTSIPTRAFADCTRITSIIIPESVKVIGAGAFYNCTNLLSIKNNGSNIEIRPNAFYNTAFYNNNKNWQGCFLFFGNELVGIKESISGTVNVPFGTKTITPYLFEGKTKIESVILPDGIVNIGNNAFDGCKGLKTITIPNSVKTIGDEAFINCSNLRTIRIPTSATKLGAGMFSGCEKLSEISIPDTITELPSSHDWNGFPVGFFGGCYSLKSLHLPTALKCIDDNAFCSCTNLSQIDISENVKNIGYEAFYGCSSLLKITVPKSVEKIDYRAFANCTNLYSIVFKSKNTELCGDRYEKIDRESYFLFEDCPNLSKIYGYKGSTVEKYAQKNYFSFVPLSEDIVAPKIKISNFKCIARTAKAQTVTWNSVKTATGYQVQISNAAANKWSTYATLKAGVTKYTFKNLVAGNNYKFRVRFFIKAEDGKNYYSPWSSILNSPTLPVGTTLIKLSPANKAFTAHWKKNSAVTGYQIQYGLKSNFSGAKTLTVKNVKTLKSDVKKLNAKKVYYVRIRTYKNITKVNYFSNWSKTYKVKTK